MSMTKQLCVRFHLMAVLNVPFKERSIMLNRSFRFWTIFVIAATSFSIPVRASEFVYVANSGSNSVSAYRVLGTGALTSIDVPVATGNGPVSVAADPKGTFLYVVDISSNDVLAFRIGESGVLTSSGPPAAAGSFAFSAIVEPSGRFGYVANASSNDISEFLIDSTGALTLIGSTGAGPTCVPSDGNCHRSIAADPTGRFVYATASGTGEISAYSISETGALTEIGAPVIGTYPFSITVEPTGRFVYVANLGGNNVAAYSIGPAGILTLIGMADAAAPGSVAADPKGKFLYVASSGFSTVYAFKIGSTGELSLIGTSNLSGFSSAIAVDPKGKFVYVTDLTSNRVTAFAIGAKGALTSIGSFATGTNPYALTVVARRPARNEDHQFRGDQAEGRDQRLPGPKGHEFGRDDDERGDRH
jgi:6-phosphogluconolactonase